MELRQLRYFVAIVDKGSLSRASKFLHIVQPALSQQLQLLEQELGTQLLHRSSRGMLMTDAGHIFYEHAQAILKQVRDAQFAVRQTTDSPSGTVVFGIPQSVCAVLALPLLEAALANFPDIELQMIEELTGTLTEQLHAGRLDFAILFDDGQLSPFDTTPLVDEDMLYITRANSRFTPKTKSIALSRALLAPLILPSMKHGVRPNIEATIRHAGLQTSSVIEITSIAILKSALMADMGATILPIAPFLSEIERGEMQAVPITGVVLTRSLVLCSSKNVPLTTAAAAIKTLLIDVVNQLCVSQIWRGTKHFDAAKSK
jgi:LysR family transcriptional regulator, nitrogen assimilation regulatory protein